MQLVLASDLAVVREKYIEVITHTKDMNIHARWIYGQHPTDAMIQVLWVNEKRNGGYYVMSNLLGYKDLPFEILNQINNVVDIWRRHLGDNLIGVYLHGSIALNAFHLDSGDIDILVVVRDSLEVVTKLEIAGDIIEIDRSPRPLEMSAVKQIDAKNWKTPGFRLIFLKNNDILTENKSKGGCKWHHPSVLPCWASSPLPRAETRPSGRSASPAAPAVCGP